MLTAARLTEDAALGSMRQTFQIMARADNLQSLDPQDCSGLAQRLLEQEVAKSPDAALYHALGQVMDKRRLTNKANEYYRQALQLADV